MTERVYFTGSRRQAETIIRDVVATIGGAGGPNADLARGIHHAVGFAALSDVFDAFISKARGGTGEDGIKWKPLHPATLAYGRRAPKGRGFAPGGNDGLLTKAQLKRWRQIYGTRLARFSLSMPMGAAKARAAQVAWATIKREGGRTKIAEYANRPHEIGRDTGVLLNSISPGELGFGGSGSTYTKPANDGGENQRFDNLANGIVVGTSVAYAAAFDADRPIFPEQAPSIWIERWAQFAKAATTAAFKIALLRGATK